MGCDEVETLRPAASTGERDQGRGGRPRYVGQPRSAADDQVDTDERGHHLIADAWTAMAQRALAT